MTGLEISIAIGIYLLIGLILLGFGQASMINQSKGGFSVDNWVEVFVALGIVIFWPGTLLLILVIAVLWGVKVAKDRQKEQRG